MNICVFMSSSDRVDKRYFEISSHLGEAIAKQGWTLIYGGGSVGLMGACARGAHSAGGSVIGVIPKALSSVEGIAYADCDELIITDDMARRKTIMEERADGFIALPGGYGTLEEILQVITLKQLGYHNKPVCFLDCLSFYEHLFTQFKKLEDELFAKSQEVYFTGYNVKDVISYITSYTPGTIHKKWF